MRVVPNRQTQRPPGSGHLTDRSGGAEPVGSSPELSLEVDRVLGPVPGADFGQIDQNHIARLGRLAAEGVGKVQVTVDPVRRIASSPPFDQAIVGSLYVFDSIGPRRRRGNRVVSQ